MKNWFKPKTKKEIKYFTKDEIDQMKNIGLEIAGMKKEPKDYREVIERVNTSLNKLHQGYLTKEVREGKGLQGLCTSVAFVLGDIICNKTKGSYRIAYGPNKYDGDEILMLINESGTELYIFDWVYKQITSGEVESIIPKVNKVLKYK